MPLLPVKGAIGYTHEHGLHRLTRRLWSWRDEFGKAVIAAGPDALWATITAG